MEIRRGTFGDFEKVVGLLRLAFPQDEARYYFSFLRFDPFFRPRDVWVAMEGQEVVSCLFVLPRFFSDGQRFLLGGGIANVATHPDFRGRGLASSLLTEAIAGAKSEGFAFLLLVTDIPAFYGRLGFRDLGKFVGQIEPERESKRALSRATTPELLESYEHFYSSHGLLVPQRNWGYLRGMRIWNRYSSHFREGERVASFGRIGAVMGYFLERRISIEVFDLFTSEDLAKASKVLGEMGKTLRLFHHPVILEKMGIPFERDSETVMVLPLREFPERLYLPPADYF